MKKAIMMMLLTVTHFSLLTAQTERYQPCGTCQPCQPCQPCAPCAPCGPCDPCAPVCGTQCGVSVCAIAIGVAAVATAAGIIIASGDGDLGHPDSGGTVH